MLKIKDFSNETGFSIRMLRYFEEVGVLLPTRDQNNYRLYKESQIDEAKWIKKLQGLGFQLKEIEKINNKNSEHLEIVGNVLKRELEVAELKSETIPMLKSIVEYLSNNEGSLQTYFQDHSKICSKKIKTLGGDEKFKRTAYKMPILKTIYEDHIADNSNIDLIATDLMKFNEWFESLDYIPEVFSILKESSFAFGKSITDSFIEGYEKSWSRFLPAMDFLRLEDFCKGDISQLMGPHDIIIRTYFKYNESGKDGEIIIPYAPIYTMSQLKN